MIHWLENSALGSVFGFAMWTLVLSPLWKRVSLWGREVRDLLDSATPGGLGDIEARLKALEEREQ
jgi:hypothetical protein